MRHEEKLNKGVETGQGQVETENQRREEEAMG
jgi:hypothetical protein